MRHMTVSGPVWFFNLLKCILCRKKLRHYTYCGRQKYISHLGGFALFWKLSGNPHFIDLNNSNELSHPSISYVLKLSKFF